MPKYAHFDPATGTVLNWMDTDAFSYPAVPDAELLEVNDVEYAARGNVVVKNGALAPYAAPIATLAQTKAGKLAEVSAACASRMASIKAGYPQDEISTWDKQESEARAYTASNTAATPLLSALAAARGITLADLAARVIAKADAFAAVSGAIIGKRQKYEDAVNAAADAAAVAAIAWAD